MKTKQEQIEEMAKKMQKCYEKNGLLNFKWFAEELLDKGYGDVTEYKAEIERLKKSVIKLAEILGETNKPKTDVIKIDEDVVERYENTIRQAQLELMRLSCPKPRRLRRKEAKE